jgi:hypothetical protein
MSRALVTLAVHGVEAEVAEPARLATAYEQVIDTEDPARIDGAAEQLIHAIFGKAASAEDPLR